VRFGKVLGELRSAFLALIGESDRRVCARGCAKSKGGRGVGDFVSQRAAWDAEALAAKVETAGDPAREKEAAIVFSVGHSNRPAEKSVRLLRAHGIQKVVDVRTAAGRKRVAIMCSEAVPWRCHRSLIADALTVRGVVVRHIMSEASAPDHRLTSFARVEGERITYPPPVAAG